jgi:hypothetical protein
MGDLTRRRLLGGTIASVTLAGLSLGDSPIALPSPAQGGPRTSSRVLLRGVNHVADYRRGDRDYWAGLWRYWDWDSWVQPQLDDIASAGNSVRFWGNTVAIADGSLSLDQYLARWEQVLDYTTSRNLLVYPCGGDLRHWGDLSVANAIEIYKELAHLWSSYTNVIAVDITNEATGALKAPQDQYSYHGQEPAAELLETLGEAVRSAGLPITHSRDIQDAQGWSTEDFTDRLGDFLDFHVYYRPSTSDSLAAYTQPWGIGKKLIIGEFGVNQAHTPSERAEYYLAVKAMCGTDENCLGAFSWSAWDQAPARIEQFGLFDNHRRLRDDVGGAFLQFPMKTL